MNTGLSEGSEVRKMMNKGGFWDGLKEWIEGQNEREMRSKLCRSLEGMKEMSEV